MDPAGVASREGHGDGGAPVVRDKLDVADGQVVEEAFDEPRQTGQRVVEMPALARASEPDQIGRDPAAPRQ
jgi:hypothetical protein